LEYVAGGVSNLFGPGSVAGVINYISKTGGETESGIIQAEWAEEGRRKGDFFFSGPIGQDTFYALSGFYRYDDGPLDSGLPSEGFQLRGNIKRSFDGAGEIRLIGQYIDDRAQFYLPLPLSGSSLERVNGADGKTVFTLNSAQASNLVSILPNGVRDQTSIEDGVSTKGGMLGILFEREIGNGWGLDAHAKWSRYDHSFDFFLDGDGVINVPETQAQYLANRTITGPATFTYVDSGAAVAPGTLLFANRIQDRERPVSDFSGQIDLTRQFETGSVTHNLTLGTWFARAEADDNTLTRPYLAEFANNPRLINLSAGGVNYTRNGLLRPSVGYTQNTHSANRSAVYVANQMQTERWALDLGLRWESIDADISRERTSTFTGLNQGGTAEAAALQTATFGNGSFQTGSVDTTEWAAAIGGLYKINDNLNVYANLSRGFFFPEIRSVAFSPLGAPSSYQGEVIEQAEAGLKVSNGAFAGTVALFWSTLENRRSVQFTNIGGGGVAEVVTLLSTEAQGVEATGAWNITDALSLEGNLTYTDHSISSSANPALVGKELERKPNWFANAGVRFDNGTFDAALFANYQGDAFANNTNTVVLPSYTLWRLGAGYKLPLENSQSLRFGVDVFNLTDSQGLAEGSPRIGNNQTAGGQYFVGRPILPRRITLTATYAF
jgi:iron complex outermembrane recepter protein